MTALPAFTMLLQRVVLATAAFSVSALAAFGITNSGSAFVVDAGSSNSFRVAVNSKSCDITSVQYRGEEFQVQNQGSHIGSGLGTATVKAETINGQYAKITCTTATLTHYVVVRSGDSTIFMATYTSAEPSIGELRFIARLQSSKLPLEYPFGSASTTSGSSSSIEGSDVFVVSGQTRSKFYSSERFIDDNVHCVHRDNDAVHACMLLNPLSYEGSSGGPFFRDINTNNAGDATNLYFYMNSGHVQTENYRMGLHGPYALSFSRNGIPTGKTMDTSFFADLGIQGYVPASGRGSVIGTASGISGNFQSVMHWYNANAQYWAYADGSGAFSSPAMKPGTYTQVLYQGELKVASSSVSVTAGRTATANMAAATQARSTIWQIGDWDSTPKGFLNADKQLRMHPSDSRMSSWGPLTYTVGSSALSSVPMALFKAVNVPLKINFVLSAAQASGAATLRVGTTLAFAGARPNVRVNSWSGPTPAAPTKIDSRGVTRGAYRGFGEVYDFNMPAGTLVVGSNTVVIDVASGSSGSQFLAPNFILDAIELFR
ncbi:Rhamnogalacturonase B [Polyplosphaeria fusca]|uniref:Rhamnogalacturonate lyase n=1 Tax=Polyplosphaeria fusca TaxID=682080 RepID=A0A9P4R346_9PLEO|nr:Rhamnogalacturonase B [Polyplosphaeria fusca]